MKRSKMMLAAVGIGLILPTAMAGCGKESTKPSTPVIGFTELGSTPEDTDNSPQTQTDTEQAGLPAPEPDSDSSTTPAEPEYLSGKVKELNADGFIFSQTVLTANSEGNSFSSVTVLDEENAEKIPVKYTPDTTFEHWTISGGGTDINKENASISDITEGMELEICGHFEGSDFIAELVIIEVYK